MIEAWLAGPVPGVEPLLMPAAHAFVQVGHEVARVLDGLSVEQIWRRPGRSASIGYHLVHLAGATDRLLTYARGEALSESQLTTARSESGIRDLDAAQLMASTSAAIDAALEQIRQTTAADLTAARAVGRQQLPSTVLGLVFHAAEHATRHAGQAATLRLIVTGD